MKEGDGEELCLCLKHEGKQKQKQKHKQHRVVFCRMMRKSKRTKKASCVLVTDFHDVFPDFPPDILRAKRLTIVSQLSFIVHSYGSPIYMSVLKSIKQASKQPA
ncbi:CLUMA_CG000938, isoform A [Clunio marinus]|uniref:CLUMA_CG000938, isoform A n=1 Tax=Clunio marinus TaxID=568069 RepID=A0A1J1HLM1_9DIPT|nr:CLUMA_CG000938, isoform A [Clunio marinus]